MKLNDNITAEVVSTKGLFKKMALVGGLTADQKLAMYNEDLQHGYSTDIAMRTRAYREKRLRLSVLNGVMRYGVDNPEGYPFIEDQGVSPFGGATVGAKFGPLQAMCNRSFGTYGTPFQPGDYGAIVSAFKSDLRARAAEIKSYISQTFNVECSVQVGFGVRKDTGSSVKIPGPVGTALGELPQGVSYWTSRVFGHETGRYVVAGLPNLTLYWRPETGFNGNDFSTYVYLSGAVIFVSFTSPYLFPLMGCGVKQYNMEVPSGAEGNEIPIQPGYSFNYTREYCTGDWPAVVFSYSAGTSTTISKPIEDYSGLVLPGLLMGAPNPIESFILDRCVVEKPPVGPVVITTSTEDLRFTVDGETLGVVLGADELSKVEMTTRRYGLWVTNRPRAVPLDPYSLIPYWSEVPAADKAQLMDTPVVEHEGAVITVKDAIKRASGKKLTKMAFLLGELAASPKESVHVQADGTPVFSTDADSWLGAYQQGSSYFTFTMDEGGPYTGPAAFVRAYYDVDVLPGSLKVTDPTNLEGGLYKRGGMDVSYHDPMDFFQGLVATHAVDRTDLVNALQAFWANGMVARDRYVG